MKKKRIALIISIIAIVLVIWTVWGNDRWRFSYPG